MWAQRDVRAWMRPMAVVSKTRSRYSAWWKACLVEKAQARRVGCWLKAGGGKGADAGRPGRCSVVGSESCHRGRMATVAGAWGSGPLGTASSRSWRRPQRAERRGEAGEAPRRHRTIERHVERVEPRPPHDKAEHLYGHGGGGVVWEGAARVRRSAQRAHRERK